MTTMYDANTAQGIINDAMHDACILGEGKTPNSEQFRRWTRRLNDLANVWQTQGIKLWLQQDYAISAPVLTAGLALYVLGPTGNVPMTKPTRIEEQSCYYADANGVQRPLIPLSRNEFNNLGTLSTQGPINSFYVDKQQFALNVTLWLTPDALAATGSVHLILQNQINNIVNITDQMMFPLEWGLALRWGLADEMASGQPQAIMDRCAERAKAYRTALEDWDVEDVSVMIQPDSRGTPLSAFR